MGSNNEEQKKNGTAKRVLAWIGIVLVAGLFIATICLAILPVPNKERLFPFFIIGCVVIPILLWIVIWIVGIFTGKRTVASFRNEETQKIMDEADEIRYREIVKETSVNAGENDKEPNE